MTSVILQLIFVVFSVGVTFASEPPVIVPVGNSKVTYIPQYFTAEDGVNITGHLAIPNGSTKPLPVVLLLLGSGPHNRYEDLPARKTVTGKPVLLFKQIEDELVGAGIAVFAYDKRGIHPKNNSFLENDVGEDFKKASAKTFASDAVAAFDHLKKLREIDPKRIGVVGHSEGTTLAVKLMESRPAIQSLFQLGIYTRSPAEMQYYQDVSAPMRLFFLLDKDQDGYVEKSEYERFSREPHWPFEDKAKPMDWRQMLVAFKSTEEKQINEQKWRYKLEADHRSDIETVMNENLPWPGAVSRNWFKEYLKEGPYLEKHLKYCGKTYVFQGEVDVLTPFEDALQLQEECQKKKTPLASFHSYPGLGHCFSKRTGLNSWRDTFGPVELTVLHDLAREVSNSLMTKTP